MERTLEATAWRRGFAAGFLALALSVGGQAASSRLLGEARSCSLAAEPGVAEQLIEHLRPSLRGQGIAQRVALALLEAMVYSRCS